MQNKQFFHLILVNIYHFKNCEKNMFLFVFLTQEFELHFFMKTIKIASPLFEEAIYIIIIIGIV